MCYPARQHRGPCAHLAYPTLSHDCHTFTSKNSHSSQPHKLVELWSLTMTCVVWPISTEDHVLAWLPPHFPTLFTQARPHKPCRIVVSDDDMRCLAHQQSDHVLTRPSQHFLTPYENSHSSQPHKPCRIVVPDDDVCCLTHQDCCHGTGATACQRVEHNQPFQILRSLRAAGQRKETAPGRGWQLSVWEEAVGRVRLQFSR